MSFAPRALLAALLIASPAWAATYKCTVSGKTTYQQSPCAEQAAAAVAPRAPAAAVAAPSSPTAADPMRGRADLVQRATPLVKAALAQLQEGRVDDYVATLCPRDRGAQGAAPARARLHALAGDLVRHRSGLGNVVDGAVQQLVFELAAAGEPAAAPRRLHTQFDWSQGQLCLRGMKLAGTD